MRKKVLLIIQIIFLFFMGTHSLSAQNQGHIFQNWVASKQIKKQGPGGMYEARVYRRFVNIDPIPYQIGVLVEFKFPKKVYQESGNEFDIKKVAKYFKESLSLEDWKEKKINKSWVFEGEWKERLRSVRLFVKEENTHIYYSMAFYRSVYQDSVSKESELIQKYLVSENITSSFKSEFINLLWSKFGVTLGYAQGGGCPRGWPAGVPCSSTGSGGSVPRWVPGQVNQSNQNWAETNETLDEILSPGGAFKVAAAGAAGAVVGVAAMTLVLDGLVAGASYIYESITHEKEDRKILQRFKQARKVYEQVGNGLVALEKNLDKLDWFLKYSGQGDSTREETIKYFGRKKQEYYSREGLKREELKRAIAQGESQACVDVLSEKVDETEKNRLFFEELEKALLAAPENKVEVCNQFKVATQKIAEMEGVLQKARFAILAGQAQYVELTSQENTQMYIDAQKVRDQSLKTNKEYKKKAKLDYESQMSELEEALQHKIDECIDKNLSWYQRIPLISPITGTFKIYKTCKKKVLKEQTRGEFQRVTKNREKALKKAEEHNKEISSLSNEGKLSPNSSVIQGEIDGFQDWFKRVAKEQACLSDPEDCDKGSLFNPRLSEKVKNSFKKCNKHMNW